MTSRTDRIDFNGVRTPQRLLYRLLCATPMRNYDVLNRFAF